jgi:CubicO group peptidase (beta-lactamase class C family)
MKESKRLHSIVQKLCALLLIAGLFSCNQHVESEDKQTAVEKVFTTFEKHLEHDVQQDDIGSISVAVFSHQGLIYSKAFGMANKGRAIAADTNTVYRVASISKSITAYLMMLFVQQGTISLDDPVENYFPEIKQLNHNGLLDTNSITFRQLANHTSGLATEPDLPDAASGSIEFWENKLMASIPATQVITIPGEKYAYSNIGYAILGTALSRAANKPFIELVEEMVFKPLHMNSSFYIIPDEHRNRIAEGYRWHPFKGTIDKEKPRTEHSGRGYKVPNGGMYSTPNDLARFLMGSTKLLSKDNLELMQTIQTPESQEYGYGLGFYIRENDKGIKMIEHDGEVAGYHAMMVINPETQIGVIMLRNYDFGLTNLLLESRTLLSKLVASK